MTGFTAYLLPNYPNQNFFFYPIGKWFRYSDLDLDKSMLYLIRTLRPVVESGDYTVVYFHTRTCRDNIPHYWWIKHVYATLGYEYKKRLKAFYVVHPT